MVVLTGPGEEAYRDAVRRELGDGASYLPALPIRDTVAVLASLDGVVVNDGGIMHASVAVGTPTVGIFGSSEPDIWFPYETVGLSHRRTNRSSAVRVTPTRAVT